MGWCSATPIFDAIGKYVLDSELSEEAQFGIMRTLADALENEDWDCQQDSAYYSHPIIKRVWKDLDPDWEDWIDDEEAD